MRKLSLLLMLILVLAMPVFVAAANIGSMTLLKCDTIKNAADITVIAKLSSDYPDTNYWRVGIVSHCIGPGTDSVKGDVNISFTNDTAIAVNPLGYWTAATTIDNDRVISDSTLLTPEVGYPKYACQFNYIKIVIDGLTLNDISHGSVWRIYLIKKKALISNYP